MSRLVTAKFLLGRDRAPSLKVWLAREARKRGFVFTGKLTTKRGAAYKALARVNYGRWQADCPNPECFGGSEYVMPEEPVYYCCSCGNYQAGGDLIPVQFPTQAQMDEIEGELLAREQVVTRAGDPGSRALSSRPKMAGFYREWSPTDERHSLAVIKAKNRAQGLEPRAGEDDG